MSMMTVTSTVDRRYFRNKTKRDVGAHINNVEQILDLPRTSTEALSAMGKDALVAKALELHAQLPDDDDA